MRLAQMAGLSADAVTDAVAFEQSLGTEMPQIVVLDLQLGGTDAVEQLRLLAARRFPGAVIVMSGFDAQVLEATAAVGRQSRPQYRGDVGQTYACRRAGTDSDRPAGDPAAAVARKPAGRDRA